MATKQELKVGFMHNPPYISRKLLANPKGIDFGLLYDILSAIELLTPLKFSYQEFGDLGSDTNIGMVENGTVDIFAKVYSYTSSRYEEIDYLYPIMFSQRVWVFKKRWTASGFGTSAWKLVLCFASIACASAIASVGNPHSKVKRPTNQLVAALTGPFLLCIIGVTQGYIASLAIFRQELPYRNIREVEEALCPGKITFFLERYTKASVLETLASHCPEFGFDDSRSKLQIIILPDNPDRLRKIHSSPAGIYTYRSYLSTLYTDIRGLDPTIYQDIGFVINEDETRVMRSIPVRRDKNRNFLNHMNQALLEIAATGLLQSMITFYGAQEARPEPLQQLKAQPELGTLPEVMNGYVVLMATGIIVFLVEKL